MEVLYLAVDPPTVSATDKKHNAGLFRRGDVITMRPDGWKWGTAEVVPPFGIAKISLSIDSGLQDYVYLLQPDPYNGDDSELLRPRTYKLDALLLDSPMTVAEFEAAIVKKDPPEKDGTVIGSDPVIT